MNVEQLNKLVKDKQLSLHHTATCKGYVSRKSKGYIVEYSGRFGKGFKHYQPNYESTYYALVSYYIYN